MNSLFRPLSSVQIRFFQLQIVFDVVSRRSDSVKNFELHVTLCNNWVPNNTSLTVDTKPTSNFGPTQRFIMETSAQTRKAT